MTYAPTRLSPESLVGFLMFALRYYLYGSVYPGRILMEVQ
jgi:hypothetical protein